MMMSSSQSTNGRFGVYEQRNNTAPTTANEVSFLNIFLNLSVLNQKKLCYL
jgi:hypothetical protein